MSPFDNSIGSGVVWGDSNMKYIVSAELSSELGPERRSVVGYDLVYTPPSADNVFKYESGKCFTIIGPQHSEFRVCSEAVSCLNDVLV